MEELANWYRGAQAEFLQLRTKGRSLHEQHFDLRYHPGETGAPRVTECTDALAAARAFEIRGDALIEAGWTRRIETNFSALNAELTAHEPFTTWARISRREAPIESIFAPWWPHAEALPAFSHCSVEERGPGEGFLLEAEWESDRGPLTLTVGPPAPPRLLSTLPPLARPIFAAHGYLGLWCVDEEEVPPLDLTLPNPGVLCSGNQMWFLNESGQLYGEDGAAHDFAALLWGTLRGTLQLALGS